MPSLPIQLLLCSIKTSIPMASFPSSSNGDNDSYVFDVFINHRGPDVKRTLATDLHRGLCKHKLRVFLDDQELQEGENITPQIKSAIRTSSVHIAIFSPGYADSQWCLDELVLMVESMHKSRSTIIPVFYGVKPSELPWARTRNGDVRREKWRNHLGFMEQNMSG